MKLALFYLWEEAGVWAHWNSSSDRHLNYLGGGGVGRSGSWPQHPVFTDMAGYTHCPQSLTYRGRSVIEPVLEFRFLTRSTKLSLAWSFPSQRETLPPLSIPHRRLSLPLSVLGHLFLNLNSKAPWYWGLQLSLFSFPAQCLPPASFQRRFTDLKS